MGKRNPKGTGTFYWNEKRQRFISEVPTGLKLKSGATHYKSKSFKASQKRQGEIYHRDMVHKVDKGEFIGGPRITFKQWTMKYLEFFTGDLKLTTVNQYRGKLETHVFPKIGRMPLVDINSIFLQELLTNMHRTQATKSVDSIRGILSSIFSEAERQGLVSSNPVKKTKPPKRKFGEKSKKQPPWSLEEARYVVGLEWGTVMNAFICLGLCTGMRKGEMLGLQWGDVDLDAGTIYIQRTLCSTTERSLDGSTTKSYLVFNTPKTVDSERFLQIQPDALVGLRTIKAFQEIVQKEKGREWNPLGLVFCEPDGRPINPSTQLSRYKRFLKKHNVRFITIHDLRHTFAEILVADEAHMHQVQQALGHREPETTKSQYARDIPVLGQQATAHMAKLLFPESQVTPLVAGKVVKKTPNKKSFKAGGRRSYG